MTTTGDLESWELRVDEALGQAARVLRAVTNGCEEGFPDPDKVEAAVSLAAAWREVANAWCDRQTHELVLTSAEDETDEEELVEEPVESRRRRR